MSGDIGSERNADAATSESFQKPENLFEVVSNPMLILKADRTIVAANEAFASLVEMPAAEFIGRKCFEVLHRAGDGQSRIPDRCPMRRASVSLKPVTECVETGGGYKYVVSCTPHLGENGAPNRFIHVIVEMNKEMIASLCSSEITESRFREKKMESVGRLAGSIAHDFNNLLLPVLVYSEMLTKDLTHRDPRRRGLDQIKEAAERAKGLTAQLLAFSQHQVLDLKINNLNRIVKNFETVFRGGVKGDIAFKTVLAPRRLTFMGDVTQVERILANLATNAVDAMPDGGALTIETGVLDTTEGENVPEELPPGRYVVLTVRDTGCGMGDDELQDIFDPFYTTKDVCQGTGLGLSTVFGIVKQHSGVVTVKSQIGEGSLFRIYLPRQEGITSSIEGNIERIELLGGDETVLVVEDDDSVRATVKHLLSNLGYRILEARDGQAGYEIAKEVDDPIALLLTDLVMPNLDGTELYHKIRKLRPEIKVLFMSGYTDDTIREHGLTLEHSDFLSKPFTVGVLASKIREKIDSE